MENGDAWFAIDKLEHFLFCFFISVFVAIFFHGSRYIFLRRWSIALGFLVSLFAGAAKEVGDEIGLWKSAGGSFKDALADVIGSLVASACLLILRSFHKIKGTDKMDGVSMV